MHDLNASPSAETLAEIDRELRTLPDSAIERLVAQAPATPTSWWGMSDAERRGWRAQNEIARRRREAARRGEQEAEQQQRDAADKAAAAAERDAVRDHLLTTAAGRALSPAALDAAIDQVLTARAVAGVDTMKADMRRRMPGL